MYTSVFFVDVLDLKNLFISDNFYANFFTKTLHIFLMYEMLQWWLLIIKGQSFK